MMRKLWIVLLLLGLWPTTLAAQVTPPEYSAFYRATTRDTNGQLVTEIGLFNNGGTAQQAAVASLTLLGADSPLVDEFVPALEANAPHTLYLTYGQDALGADVGAGDFVTLELRITSSEFVPVRRLIEFAVPEPLASTPTPDVAPTPQAPPTETAADADSTGLFASWRAQVESWLAFLPFAVDLDNPVHARVLAVVVLFAVLLLWLFWLVLRLMFKRPAVFPSAPPPYTAMQPYPPNTLPGRRQMWQNVTYHGSMLAEQTAGNLHSRKLLTDTRGQRYAGWSVVGLRASQYDSYGRVSRSQAIAERKHLRHLSRVAARAHRLNAQQAQRQVRGTARWLANRLLRRMSGRSAGLDIALDVKFKGAHGEVAIWFELYQYQGQYWQKLDNWQPEMVVAGRSIYETYTYTVRGRAADETHRAFARHLREEVAHLLAEMILCTPPAPPPSATPTPPHGTPSATPTPPHGTAIPPESMETVRREVPKR